MTLGSCPSVGPRMPFHLPWDTVSHQGLEPKLHSYKWLCVFIQYLTPLTS